MTREALGKVVACTALAVSWLAAVPRVSQGQALSRFPFGHEADSHVGVFAYYPELTSYHPDPPPIGEIFCDQIPSPRGWVVFYVYQWQKIWNPTKNRVEWEQFPTDPAALRWAELHSALEHVRHTLKLVPILRLHWMDNSNAPAAGVPPVGWIYPDIVPPGQHWSVPVDTETYDRLRGANPTDKDYQDVAATMRNDFVDWCTRLARSLRADGRNDCRWFIIGNELNHPAEYGNHETIVPPYWYARLWADCFAGMGRDPGESGCPTKCQVLVAALTPHSPTAGQPWQDKLELYARSVDYYYKRKFGTPPPDSAAKVLLPGFAVHGYPSAAQIRPGGIGLPVFYLSKQFSDYISTVENTTVDDGMVRPPIYTLAALHPTEYVIDEYNAWTSTAGPDTPYPQGYIPGILDHVQDLRSQVAPNRLRAACYYAFRVPHYGSDTWYDLVVPKSSAEGGSAGWESNPNRNLTAAFNDLKAYTGCAPPPEPRWLVDDAWLLPSGARLVGCEDLEECRHNVLDGDPGTYFGVRLDSPVLGYNGPGLCVVLAPITGVSRQVIEIRVTIHVDRPVTNASLWIEFGSDCGFGNCDGIGFDNVTLTDGRVFSTEYTPGLIDEIRVSVDCSQSTDGTGLNNNIGVAEIKIVDSD